MLHDVIVADICFPFVEPSPVYNVAFIIESVPISVVQQVEVFSHFNCLMDLLFYCLVIRYMFVLASFKNLFEYVNSIIFSSVLLFNSLSLLD